MQPDCPNCLQYPAFWDRSLYACMVCGAHHEYSSCCSAPTACEPVGVVSH
jgi:hypothetical protein